MTDYFVHSQGLCETDRVGAGTRIWAFAHVLPGAVLGANCNICDQVFIENDVVVGDDTTVKCGVQLWDGVRLGNKVFVGPNATFTNDRFPRSRQYPQKFLETVVEDNASIGANATILPGVRIGYAAMVGAGAVVTKDVPPNAIVVGNPAVIVGYQSQGAAHTPVKPALVSPEAKRSPVGVGDCAIWRLPHFSDLRGDLAPLEFARDLPFVPQRSFMVYDVPSTKVRGEHAHLVCHQFLIAARGRLKVLVDDGHDRAEIELADPTTGLYMPPRIWGSQYHFERDTILMVFASHPYDSGDYIRDYSDFRKIV